MNNIEKIFKIIHSIMVKQIEKKKFSFFKKYNGENNGK